MNVNEGRPPSSIKEQASLLGFYLCGVSPASPPPHYDAYLRWLKADMHGEMAYMQRHALQRGEPASLLDGVKSVIVVGLNYARDGKDPRHRVQEGHAKFAAYSLGRDYHKVIRQRLKKLAAWLTEQAPESRHRVCVDSAPMLERDYAMMAGLGWYGKNTCLINTHRGSLFLIGCLLTTLDLEPDTPAVGGCGTCRLCLDACPTGAIVDPYTVDARKCISYLTIEKRGELPVGSNLDGWVFGCDDCQDVCPFNHPRENAPLRGQPTEDPELQPRFGPVPPLAELASVSEDEFNQRYAGTAIMRAKWHGLTRNAKTNLIQ